MASRARVDRRLLGGRRFSTHTNRPRHSAMSPLPVVARLDRAVWSGTIAFRNEYFSDATDRIRRPSVLGQMARSRRAMTFSSGAIGQQWRRLV